MDFNGAVNEVLDLKNKIGSMPNYEDYERLGVDTEELAKALGIRLTAGRTSNGVRPYAAINIAVVRELRRRENQPVRIVTPALY